MVRSQYSPASVPVRFIIGPSSSLLKREIVGAITLSCASIPPTMRTPAGGRSRAGRRAGRPTLYSHPHRTYWRFAAPHPPPMRRACRGFPRPRNNRSIASQGNALGDMSGGGPENFALIGPTPTSKLLQAAREPSDYFLRFRVVGENADATRAQHVSRLAQLPGATLTTCGRPIVLMLAFLQCRDEGGFSDPGGPYRHVVVPGTPLQAAADAERTRPKKLSRPTNTGSSERSPNPTYSVRASR